MSTTIFNRGYPIAAGSSKAVAANTHRFAQKYGNHAGNPHRSALGSQLKLLKQ
ncbi:hypothetical protein [Bradyrhizobium sp. CCBAU 51753]|uniref:hypothetical protein n=1 Tax=Bradyrhizobium sp. CCBAU 51753 TaxID=1325100 RepID=UPI00188A6F2B|nr:hypothetical protein [Bradyrhizobium sp. CCBAU 51753]